MLGVLALLEALQHAVLARCDSQLVAALGHVGLTLRELAGAADALRLDLLDDRLAGAQLLNVDLAGRAGRAPLLGADALEALLDGLQALVASPQSRDGLGELFAREVLAPLAQCAHALEAEAERGAHGRVIGRCSTFLRAEPYGDQGALRRVLFAIFPQSPN